MAKPLDARIQFFASQVAQKIQDLESGLLTGFSYDEEKKTMFRCEILQDVLESFEDVFDDILYKEG